MEMQKFSIYIKSILHLIFKMYKIVQFILRMYCQLVVIEQIDYNKRLNFVYKI